MSGPKLDKTTLEKAYAATDIYGGLDALISATASTHLPTQAITLEEPIYKTLVGPISIRSGEDPKAKFNLSVQDGKLKLPRENQGSVLRFKGLKMYRQANQCVEDQIFSLGPDIQALAIRDDGGNIGFKFDLTPLNLSFFQPIIQTPEVQNLAKNGVKKIPREIPLVDIERGTRKLVQSPPPQRHFTNRADLLTALHSTLAALRFELRAAITQPLFRVSSGEALWLDPLPREGYGHIASLLTFVNPFGERDKKAQRLADTAEFSQERIESTLTHRFSRVVVSLAGLDVPLEFKTSDLLNQLGGNKERFLEFFEDCGYTVLSGDVYIPNPPIHFIKADGSLAEIHDLKFLKDVPDAADKERFYDKKAQLTLNTAFRMRMKALRSSSGLWAEIPLSAQALLKTKSQIEIGQVAGALTLGELGSFTPFDSIRAGIELSHDLTLRQGVVDIPKDFTFAGLPLPQMRAELPAESKFTFDGFEFKYDPADGVGFKGSFKAEVHARNVEFQGRRVLDAIDADLTCASAQDSLLTCQADGSLRLTKTSQPVQGSFEIKFKKGADSLIQAEIGDLKLTRDQIRFGGLKLNKPALIIKDADVKLQKP